MLPGDAQAHRVGGVNGAHVRVWSAHCVHDLCAASPRYGERAPLAQSLAGRMFCALPTHATMRTPNQLCVPGEVGPIAIAQNPDPRNEFVRSASVSHGPRDACTVGGVFVAHQTQIPANSAEETVRVSIRVSDDRGFTHYYQDVVTTPDAVRDAFALLLRRAPSVGDRLLADEAVVLG